MGHEPRGAGCAVTGRGQCRIKARRAVVTRGRGGCVSKLSRWAFETLGLAGLRLEEPRVAVLTCLVDSLLSCVAPHAGACTCGLCEGVSQTGCAGRGSGGVGKGSRRTGFAWGAVGAEFARFTREAS